MRAQRVFEFQRGKDPKESLRIGKAHLENEWKEIQDQKGYVDDKTFNGKDDLIIHIFGKVYDKWKNQTSINPEDVVIWSDSTYSGTPIIKFSAPGVRETTMLRWESDPGNISGEVEKFIESDEIRERVAKNLSQEAANPEKLGRMVWENGNRRKITWGSITYAYKVADRLMELLG